MQITLTMHEMSLLSMRTYGVCTFDEYGLFCSEFYAYVRQNLDARRPQELRERDVSQASMRFSCNKSVSDFICHLRFFLLFHLFI